MKKKIGVLTQPLHDNYGGLLQAYALKEVLLDLGHEVVIINRRKKETSKVKKVISYIYSVLKGKVKKNSFLNEELLSRISYNTNHFRSKYLPEVSERIVDNKGMRNIGESDFDVFIVGSDQCWRPRYSPSITNYYFDFIENNNSVKRLSFAASFGVGFWEYNPTDTDHCKRLIKKFDAISVREDSGIKLVKDYLDRNDAIHVVDPTMLLSISHYKDLMRKEKASLSPGTIFTYILDKNEEKQSFVSKIEKHLKSKSFEVYPKKRFKNETVNNNNVFDFVFPSPAQWLQAYDDASFVIADSFHGIVFSILFNIPFIALGNKARGLARFTSLLKMFGLENRLVTNISEENIEDLLKSKIDWNKVNIILEKERIKAIKFLTDNI